jgi:hypothetical protein
VTILVPRRKEEVNVESLSILAIPQFSVISANKGIFQVALAVQELEGE